MLARPIDLTPTRNEMPLRADVVIVGGGIVGVSTALFLAERGISVAVCEKGIIGGEQSSRNWGLVRQFRRDPAEMELMKHSAEIWKGLKERVNGETGFAQKGLLFTCDSEADLVRFEKPLRTAREFGLGTRILTQAEVLKKIPGITRQLAAGVFTPSDAHAEPQHAAPSIAMGAAAKGATILTNCAVRGLETSGGRISAVVTERGAIKCETAVIATGLWSRRFLRNEGFDFPSLNIHTWVQATAPMDGPPDEVVYGSDFLFRRRLDGGWNIGQLDQTVPLVPDIFKLGPRYLKVLKSYMGGFRMTLGRPFARAIGAKKRWTVDDVTPFETERILELPVDHKVLAASKARTDAVVPYFHKARMAYGWTGVFDVTPDELPVMSQVEGRPGLVIATGFSGHGFGIGPAAGELVADIVSGRRPRVDIRPFRFSRFSRSD